MATPISIVVLSEQNGSFAPETNAEVVVGRRDLVGDSDYPYDDLLATFKHDAGGHYVNSTGDPENEPDEGEWLIVVRKQGFSLVVQKLTYAEKEGILRATPGWKEPGVPKGVAGTVSIVNFDQATGAQQGAQGARQSVVTLRLFPAQRFVGMGCRDNHGGTRFTLFAAGRRDFLYDTGKLNAGCIATLFDCLENRVITAVKGSKASPKDWLEVHSGAPLTEKATILDFYTRLDTIGQKEPNTVLEAGIFGHAWHQGPIVQDTFDRSSDLDVRDPDDADGRPKDFYPNGKVPTDFASFKAAFASDGRFVVWGCSMPDRLSPDCSERERDTWAGA